MNSTPSQLQKSMGSNNTLFESVPIELDTECMLLLGLLYCKDRKNQKASIFYSILRGSNSQKYEMAAVHKNEYSIINSTNNQNKESLFTTTQSNNSKNFEELHCMDEGIESTIFKLCILSTMFTEYHALPARPGKTEVKMLHMAFAMRTSVFFEVFQTFIQHVWSTQEQFYVSRKEFIEKMSEYPLTYFLEAATFRKMITLRMPDSASGIHKRRDKVQAAAANNSNVALLENQSRPNLEKYGYQASIYEKSEISMNKTIIDNEYSREMQFMMASTKS